MFLRAWDKEVPLSCCPDPPDIPSYPRPAVSSPGMPAGCARVVGEGKVVWEGQPHRGPTPHSTLWAEVSVSGGQQAERGQNSCPEDNEARGKGFRERDWGAGSAH